jgi:anaerobic magnesium-protoporphyrin IX monomethyl ester cyclase
MRILLVHPNHLSGGAEIAGIWPLASAAYLAGAPKGAGYTNALVLDAMADRIPDEKPAEPIRDAHPDIIGTTAITPVFGG